MADEDTRKIRELLEAQERRRKRQENAQVFGALVASVPLFILVVTCAVVSRDTPRAKEEAHAAETPPVSATKEPDPAREAELADALRTWCAMEPGSRIEKALVYKIDEFHHAWINDGWYELPYDRKAIVVHWLGKCRGVTRLQDYRTGERLAMYAPFMSEYGMSPVQID